MTIDFSYDVVTSEPSATRFDLVSRLAPSRFFEAHVAPYGFNVRVTATVRPADDIHLQLGFEAARALTMITRGTLFDPITARSFAALELDHVDAASLDAHVCCFTDVRHGLLLHAVSAGLVKYGLPEIRLVLGGMDDDGAARAVAVLDVACHGIASGIYPSSGGFEMIGETWVVHEGAGVLLLEPTSCSIHTLVDAQPVTACRPSGLHLRSLVHVEHDHDEETLTFARASNE